MHWVMLPSRSKLRWCDGEPLPSHSGLALLSRWPITHHTAVELPCTADDGERAALLCQVQLPSGCLIVANVHLTHLAQMDALRHAQLKTVLDHTWLGSAGGASGVAGAANAANAAVVCGDFNAPLQSESLGGFITPAAPWLDAVSAAGMSSKVTCPAAGPKAQDVDHVLSLKTSRLRWSRAFTALEQPDPDTGVQPSDHYAVCVNGQLLP
jgi:endonuclease/exonuclease/phosphatase family metal-dependent hydrolase